MEQEFPIGSFSDRNLHEGWIAIDLLKELTDENLMIDRKDKIAKLGSRHNNETYVWLRDVTCGESFGDFMEF